MSKQVNNQEEESKLCIEKVAELSIDDMNLVEILSHDRTISDDFMTPKSAPEISRENSLE